MPHRRRAPSVVWPAGRRPSRRPAAEDQDEATTISTPTTRTPPTASSRQSGSAEPRPASTRRLSASSLARSRRWTPEVRRRLAIRRGRIAEDPDSAPWRRVPRVARIVNGAAWPPRIADPSGGAMTTGEPRAGGRAPSPWSGASRRAPWSWPGSRRLAAGRRSPRTSSAIGPASSSGDRARVPGADGHGAHDPARVIIAGYRRARPGSSPWSSLLMLRRSGHRRRGRASSGSRP